MPEAPSQPRPDLTAMLDHLERLVMSESPSDHPDAVEGCIRHVSDLCLEILGERPRRLERDGRTHLLLASGHRRPVLLLAHLDTVWPLGTTASWPFQCDGDRATGPGVFDMKAGLVQGLHAMALRCGAPVDLLITSDEEIGSPTSRALVEQQARRARAVLVLEPSADGAPKISRKGVSMYRLEISGQAAHAGLEPEKGANALLELAHQVTRVAALSAPNRGTTVTPTVAAAGTSTNTVPAGATLAVDVRAADADEQQRVDIAIRRVRTQVAGTRLHVSGGINRPPMEREMSASLMALADACAQDLGLALPRGRDVGGGSDGNFTAALGVPTLDGVGAVGAHAHALGEYVVISTMRDRAALVARMIDALTDDREAVTT